MRTSRGVLLPPVRARRIRRADVYRALRGAVLDGSIAAGEQLPSSREAAADYGVSRGMIEEVFAQLVDEGFLERAVGRGTFVSPSVAQLEPAARTRRGETPSASRRGSAIAANAACREPEASRAFNAGIADTSQFPWKIWHRLQTRADRELGGSALDFADPRGLFALRAAIARYLAQFRGIRCTASEIVVFSSAQQAIHALALLLLNRSDRILLEDPCYLGARAAFDLAGAAITPVPVDDEGMIVRDVRARLAYVTPPHQYPTGVAMSLDRRIALIDWAVQHNAWIVEDDYDGEFRYEGQPLTPLHALDTHGRVIYVGTLNKAMFVGLRLAFAVVPEELVEPLANIRTQLDGFTPALPQMTMSTFMEEGHFATHLRRMRAVYAAKRALLVERLEPLATRGWTWSPNAAGMHLLIRHPSARHVREIARDSDLDLALLSAYRTIAADDDGFFLRFGALSERELHRATEQLVRDATGSTKRRLTR